MEGTIAHDTQPSLRMHQVLRRAPARDRFDDAQDEPAGYCAAMCKRSGAAPGFL